MAARTLNSQGADFSLLAAAEGNLARSGLLAGEALAAFEALLARTMRWRDAWLPEAACLAAAVLTGVGLYGVIVHPHPIRKLLALNVLGSGVFLLFGAIAHRGAAAGLDADPVPQALLITGIVVAFSATALAVALLLRLSGTSDSLTLDEDGPHAKTRTEGTE
jgi:multicomponent Na+:H+ antiporter subunit C